MLGAGGGITVDEEMDDDPAYKLYSSNIVYKDNVLAYYSPGYIGTPRTRMGMHARIPPSYYLNTRDTRNG